MIVEIDYKHVIKMTAYFWHKDMFTCSEYIALLFDMDKRKVLDDILNMKRIMSYESNKLDVPEELVKSVDKIGEQHA